MMGMRHNKLSAPADNHRNIHGAFVIGQQCFRLFDVYVSFLLRQTPHKHTTPKYHLENHSIHKHENSLNFTFYMVHTADTWNALNKNSRCFVA